MKTLWRRHRKAGESLKAFARRQARGARMGGLSDSIEMVALDWLERKRCRP